MFFGLTDRRRTDCDEAPFRAHGLTAGTGRSKLWRHRSDIPVQSKRVPMRVPCAVPRLATWSARGVSVSCVGSVQRPRGSPRRLKRVAMTGPTPARYFRMQQGFPTGTPDPPKPKRRSYPLSRTLRIPRLVPSRRAQAASSTCSSLPATSAAAAVAATATAVAATEGQRVWGVCHTRANA